MTETKSLHSGNAGSLLSPREEAERFAVAAERFLERANQNPEVATQMLRKIGYFEMMEQQHKEEAQTATNGVHPNGSTKGADGPPAVSGENTQR